MYNFDGWTLDELHTVCTMAGNAVKNMDRVRVEMKHRGATARYMDRCIDDAEELLEAAVDALENL